MPNIVEEAPIKKFINHCEEMVSPLNGVTMNGIKQPLSPVKCLFLQNNIKQ